MARQLHSRILLIVAAASAIGCSSTIHRPQLRSPGPAKYQRANAEAFDPYPLPDLGPEIDGGRPREFGIPRNEVERAQDYSIVQAARRNSLTTQAPAVPFVGGSSVPMTMPGTTAPAFTPTTPSVPSYTPSAPVYSPPAATGVPSYPTIPTTPSYSPPTGQPGIRY
ncbi:hypothetical protein [Lacipirellula sp.]|uniref:hypothetical protein n=1 Tax=Lacipirellula sp. TaxID=2691419 RepID=UPI003D0A55B8